MGLTIKIKYVLYSLIVLSVVIMALSFFSLKSKGSVDRRDWEALGLFGSTLAYTVCFFPLCYRQWFIDAPKDIFYYGKQLFFWLLASLFVFIFFNIGRIFLVST